MSITKDEVSDLTCLIKANNDQFMAPFLGAA